MTTELRKQLWFAFKTDREYNLLGKDNFLDEEYLMPTFFHPIEELENRVIELEKQNKELLKKVELLETQKNDSDI